MVEFGILGFLLCWGFFTVNASIRKKFILVFSTGSILALLDEIHQFFVPQRTLEILDLAADIIGIGAGFFIFVYFYNKNKRLGF